MSQAELRGSSIVQIEKLICVERACRLLLHCVQEIRMTSARIQAGKGDNQRPAKAYPLEGSA